MKVRQEMETIKARLTTMREEMLIYEDIDRLKAQAQEKRESLIKEQESLLLRKDTTRKVYLYDREIRSGSVCLYVYHASQFVPRSFAGRERDVLT